MVRRRRVLGVLVGCLLGSWSGLAAQPAGPAATRAVELKTAEFSSPAVGRTLKYNVLLPGDYAATTTRYPVLYLLHGLTQNYTAWGRNNGAPIYAAHYPDLIIVMPDGGNSWYVNWAAGENGQNNWADYIVKDLIGHVDSTYRTIARREGRALSGLSMGGYGSITLGLRHPELFASIGSTSGALEYARQAGNRLRGLAPRQTPRPRSAEEEERRRQPNPLIGIPGFSSQVERTLPGEPFARPEDADAFDPFVLIQQVAKERLPHIYLDCGTEDRLISGARELAGILMEKDIPFDYMQMAGEHNAAYWTRSIGRLIAVQYEVMQRALGRRPSR